MNRIWIYHSSLLGKNHFIGFPVVSAMAARPSALNGAARRLPDNVAESSAASLVMIQSGKVVRFLCRSLPLQLVAPVDLNFCSVFMHREPLSTYSMMQSIDVFCWITMIQVQ